MSGNNVPGSSGGLRSEKGSKLAALEKISHFQSRVLALEREKASHLYSKKHEFRASFSSLEEAELKLAVQRKIEKNDLRQQIDRIRASVEVFKRSLSDVKPGPAFVEKLKQSLEDIESSILAFKEKQRQVYESLLQAERVTSQEVTAFERRLDAWQSAGMHTLPASAPPAAARGPVSTGEPSSVPPAVMDFERFLQQTGGRQGGWDDYDHQTFLKIRSKFNGQEGFIEGAARELPTRSREEVEKHEQWYVEYCALLERKKTAIEAWKRTKESSKAEQRAKAEDHPTDSSPRGPKKDAALAKEREERLAKLRLWKAEQEEKRVKVEEERQAAEAERTRKMEREKKKQEELRQRVREAARQREEQRRKEEEEEEEVRKSREAAQRRAATREIHRFRDRDLQAAEEKKERLKAKELERLESERKLEKLKGQVEVHVSRDPSRLFKPTAGWEERKKAGSGSGMGGAITSMPRRAVPSWRQGL